MATTSTQSYAYVRSSSMSGDGLLDLETSGGVSTLSKGTSSTVETSPNEVQAHPRFFSGWMSEAEPAAAALLGLANVAAAHYYRRTPTPYRDPVVTCDGERLRFESFSACCGVYARLDVLPDGIEGDWLARGTTNVDINSGLRFALGRVRGADPLRLGIGPDGLEAATLDGVAVERKVPLPGRWLRGFAQVQALTSGFEPRAGLAAAEAARFLRGLPNTSRGVMWAMPAGRGLRLTTRAMPGAVCLPGTERLKELLALLRFGGALTVYGPALSAGAALPVSSCWQLDLPGMRMTLALSPEASRGFSGEGAVLAALAGEDVSDDAEEIGRLLDFQGRIDPDVLADRSGLSRERVRAALSLLGTSGRVGFDAAQAAFFHRELPYDAARAMKDNPRLAAAQALVEAGAVIRKGDISIVCSDEAAAAAGGGHQVRFTGDDQASCTCMWWMEYRGGRGPCKHVLAAQLERRGVFAAAAAAKEG
jgi:hypothetical protein